MVERVLATQATLDLIERLKQKHGPLMFHQSGGCCDGSAPMCYAAGEFRVGGNDVKLGQIGGCDVYMDADQFDYWKHTQLIIDVVPGRGHGFTLEAPEGLPAACSPTKRLMPSPSIRRASSARHQS